MSFHHTSSFPQEEDTWESWEDTDPTEIQLATTPVKEVLGRAAGAGTEAGPRSWQWTSVLVRIVIA